MARKPQPVANRPITAPQHAVMPTARELRAQTVQRLQVGLFGLAAMLLLVALANIIMDRARLAEDAMPPVSANAGKAPSDPLADLGVAPATEPSGAPPVPGNK